MLRITRSTSADMVRLALSGRIARAGLGELERVVASEAVPPGALTLDLGEVELLDRDAVRFLVTCEAAGMRIENAVAYVREWMRSERRGSAEAPSGGGRSRE